VNFAPSKLTDESHAFQLFNKISRTDSREGPLFLQLKQNNIFSFFLCLHNKGKDKKDATKKKEVMKKDSASKNQSFIIHSEKT